MSHRLDNAVKGETRCHGREPEYGIAPFLVVVLMRRNLISFEDAQRVSSLKSKHLWGLREGLFV